MRDERQNDVLDGTETQKSSVFIVNTAWKSQILNERHNISAEKESQFVRFSAFQLVPLISKVWSRHLCGKISSLRRRGRV
jgi:hypothetical protein